MFGTCPGPVANARARLGALVVTLATVIALPTRRR
jgi:hypothetical protein